MSNMALDEKMRIIYIKSSFTFLLWSIRTTDIFKKEFFALEIGMYGSSDLFFLDN